MIYNQLFRAILVLVLNKNEFPAHQTPQVIFDTLEELLLILAKSEAVCKESHHSMCNNNPRKFTGLSLVMMFTGFTSIGPSLQNEHFPCSWNSFLQIFQHPPFGGPLRWSGSIFGWQICPYEQILLNNFFLISIIKINMSSPWPKLTIKSVVWLLCHFSNLDGWDLRLVTNSETWPLYINPFSWKQSDLCSSGQFCVLQRLSLRRIPESVQGGKRQIRVLTQNPPPQETLQEPFLNYQIIT